MFSLLKEALSSPGRALTRPGVAREASSDSFSTAITVDVLSNAQESPSSTPPTSLEDSVSVSSASLNLERTDSASVEDSPKRSQRRRAGVNTYNIKVLSGTSIKAPRKYLKDQEGNGVEARRRTLSGDTMEGALLLGNTSMPTIERDKARFVRDGIDALDLQWSVKKLAKSKSQNGLRLSPTTTAKLPDFAERRATRSTGEKAESFTTKLAVLGKRSRKTFEGGLTKAKRELRNLADTLEFAHIDTKPVVHEVWSNGKLVTKEPPKKKVKIEEAVTEKSKHEDAQSGKKVKSSGKKEKVWLNKGIYAGQDAANLDWFVKTSKKQKDSISPSKPGMFMPLPMWHGQRLLHNGRNFKLPFDVCAPLPPGQPKPDEWRKTSSNRFVGEAGALWKKSNLFDSFSSKCICSAENGCDDDCQNRIMLYECDDSNCGAGKEYCNNRAFADLQERRKGGGKFRIGVEVIKTADRGHGVRSNRCFEPNQIIVEYTGEIITEDECDRRMNEDYKDNECYYLMSFDQNMIIDATKGSIARFVNHSCSPNCRMVKWIVGGKPRMALFAGDKHIMTGEELTYDYNFDPFSSKNVQECRCGSENCRGVLGPRPKDQKPIKEAIKDAVKATVKAGKRKLKEFLGVDGDGEGQEEDKPSSPKKRKIAEAKGAKKPALSASTKVVRSAAKATKKTISTQLTNARQAVNFKREITVKVKKTVKANTLKTYGKKQKMFSSRNSSLTIVAADVDSPMGKKLQSSPRRNSMAKNVVNSIRSGQMVASSRTASENTIRAHYSCR